MRIQNIFRMQVIVIGIGAALLLVSSAHAQEVENTVWDDGPNVAPFTQLAPAQSANEIDLTSAESYAVRPGARVPDMAATQELKAFQWTPAEGWLFVSFLVCIGLVRLYSLARAKRSNRKLNVRASHFNSRAAIS
jgi:hypothetical protein